MNCSTSNFIGSNFTRDGKHLATFFDDSSVFFWDLGDYSSEETSVPFMHSPTAANVGLGKYIVSADESCVYAANYLKDRSQFDKIAQVEGRIWAVDFAGHCLLVLSTHGLYLGHIH